ncbi:helix-turn-helix transcriptional regulator [Fodinicurvata sp. EGI_FJ10296]|uniref:helix-turn-helix domain-containing protein n=1 Tax=Fodinicurvata sp. EGI_FJ10296 TaxID=3231908 RepID=UPI003451DC88
MADNFDPSDPTRLRLIDLVERHGTNLAAVSRAVGRNHAYLHQFVNRGTPKRLSYEVCQALGEYFDVDWSVFWEGGRRPTSRSAGNRMSSVGGRNADTANDQSFVVRLSLARLTSPYKTPAQFSAAMGIDRSRYADLEDGVEEPSIGELDRISKISGKTLDWLIRGLEQGEGDSSKRNKRSAGRSSAIDIASAGDFGVDRGESSPRSGLGSGEWNDGSRGRVK